MHRCWAKRISNQDAQWALWYERAFRGLSLAADCAVDKSNRNSHFTLSAGVAEMFLVWLSTTWMHTRCWSMFADAGETKWSSRDQTRSVYNAHINENASWSRLKRSIDRVNVFLHLARSIRMRSERGILLWRAFAAVWLWPHSCRRSRA